jgi:hypothetical protein
MRLDDPRIKENWPASIVGEHSSDDGDPVAALRAHFEENVGRLGQQIDQAERELRSLQLQLYAFVAGLQALDGPKTEATTTLEHQENHASR